MQLQRIFIVLVLVVLSIRLSSAEAQDEVGLLATLLDQRAAANGLSSGDGNISATERSISTALIDEITGFNELVTGFETDSADNSAWVENAEVAVQNYNERVALDPRAEAISAAVDQYVVESEPIIEQAPIDPRAEAISRAVEQYAGDPVIDPRGEAISHAVAQYGVDENGGVDPRAEAISRAVEQYGQQILDPRAEAISAAVAQYMADSDADSYEDRQRVTDTVRESANEYVNQSNVRRPGITKRHVNHLIQFMVPNAMLPINGYWRILPFSMITSGDCIDTYGDNDGPPTNGNDEDPGQPLCGYAEAGELPFIVWNDIHPYLPGSSSIYSQLPHEEIVMTSDRSGASTGSLLITTTTEYEVVAPDRILVHLLIQEEGGCSMTADYVLELVTPDESVCPAISAVSTPEPTLVPPEVVEGPYTVGMPFYTDEAQCTEANTPPELGDELSLFEQADGSVLIDYGAGTQLVYGGDGFYQFDTGMDAAVRQLVTLVLFEDGSGGNVSWSNNAKDGNICYVSHDLTLPGFESDAPVSTPAPEDDPNNGTSSDIPPAPPLTAGNYTVTWSAFPGLECAPELEALLPKFPEATLAANGSAYTLTAGGTTYELTEANGQYYFMAFEDDNSGMTLTVYDGALAMLPEGHWGGTYTYFTPDAEMCINQLDFAPAS